MINMIKGYSKNENTTMHALMKQIFAEMKIETEINNITNIAFVFIYVNLCIINYHKNNSR